MPVSAGFSFRLTDVVAITFHKPQTRKLQFKKSSKIRKQKVIQHQHDIKLGLFIKQPAQIEE
ncbi:CLUMA_CG014974, isoform A [Clunio marinus]|uniref:CLUMA_CG014974, isoform A n=1 Tax=Clunio marinus TaxID=568069 RepID=A0A1J1IRP8_9DIPT|nr:CLUMA_CG014974, isoform A [Clunio marinus]